MAVATRGGSVAGVIFHSDRGCQYTSADFRALCDAHGVQQSMGKTGVCWDNALSASFFATYKLELIEPATWPTRARTATIHWLEAVYNRQRRHSAIDMLSPSTTRGGTGIAARRLDWMRCTEHMEPLAKARSRRQVLDVPRRKQTHRRDFGVSGDWTWRISSRVAVVTARRQTNGQDLTGPRRICSLGADGSSRG